MRKKRIFSVSYVYSYKNGFGYRGSIVTIDKCHKKLNEKQLDDLRKEIIKNNNVEDIVIINLIELKK